MAKVFIDALTSSREHTIFTGKNALKHALYYEQHGRVCTDEAVLYNMDIGWLKGVWWDSSGGGNHSKIYQTKKSIIYSSQNKGNSPLFEFAILYDKRSSKTSKIAEFTQKTFARVAAYKRWWDKNKTEWR